MWRPPPMLRRVCNARSLLTELLVSDVEPLVSDVDPLVSDVETTCKTYITSPLCPRLRRKGCVAQDRLLAEPRTVPEMVRRRALTTLHQSSTACLGSPHHTDAPAASLTSLLLSFTFAVYCPFSPFSPAVYPAFILQHSTTTTNDFNCSVQKWPLVDPYN